MIGLTQTAIAGALRNSVAPQSQPSPQWSGSPVYTTPRTWATGASSPPGPRPSDRPTGPRPGGPQLVQTNAPPADLLGRVKEAIMGGPRHGSLVRRLQEELGGYTQQPPTYTYGGLPYTPPPTRPRSPEDPTPGHSILRLNRRRVNRPTGGV